ncbi:hypothetical protein Tco_1490558 [Tanacetum coccineum]
MEENEDEEEECFIGGDESDFQNDDNEIPYTEPELDMQNFHFEKAKKERDDLKLTLEKFENSSKNLSKLLEIQVSDKFKTSVGLCSQVVDVKWLIVSEDENETEFKSKQKKPSFAKVEFVKSNEHVKIPRESIEKGNPQLELQEKGVIDNGCSRHMTRNKSYLLDYEEIDGGFVAFRGGKEGC